MLIKSFTSVSEEVIKEIREAETNCKTYDNLNGSITLDPSLNFDANMKNLFLLYEGNKLISVLSVFAPTADEAEISAFTLPEYRQKGCFKKLLSKAADELDRYKPLDLLFVCEPQSKAGKEVLKRLNAGLDFTEYFLRYNAASGCPEEKPARIKLHRAGLKDLEGITELSMQVFNDDYENAKSMIEKSVKSDNRTQYTATLDGELIGMGAVSIENGEASIFGVGISPQYQGKKFGKELLILILDDLKEHGTRNVTIEVDSKNRNAFELYKKCGFEIEASFDYYRKRI